jgi:sugar phosphate isomerase/epimerase
MIKFAFGVDRFKRLSDEVNFAKENGFSFLQIWYDNNGISINREDLPAEISLKTINVPFIFHAVLKPIEFKTNMPIISKLLTRFKHDKLIIHPVCDPNNIPLNRIELLNENIKIALKSLAPLHIKLFLENNSKIEPLFQTPSEIEFIFKKNPTVELLLDIAHIDDYNYMENVVKIKYPKLLHCADRDLKVTHDHLPLGKDNIDFAKIFSEIIPDFEGGIIFEIFQSNEDRKKAIDLIRKILHRKISTQS